MFIWKHNQKRCNPNMPYVDSEGVTHLKVPAALYTEIPDPIPPEDYDHELYYTTEQDDAPYVVYTKKSPEQIQAVLIKRYETALDNHLDEVARQYRYDNRFTFALRAGYNGPYQTEGKAFASWMDTCNLIAYDLMKQCIAGNKPPSVQEFISSLPLFTI